MAFSFGSTPAAAPAFGAQPRPLQEVCLVHQPPRPPPEALAFRRAEASLVGLFGAAPAPAPAGGLFGASTRLLSARPPRLAASSARKSCVRRDAGARAGGLFGARPAFGAKPGARGRPLRRHNDHGLRTAADSPRCPRLADGADRAAATGFRRGPRGLRSEGGHRRVHGPGPAEPRRAARDALL